MKTLQLSINANFLRHVLAVIVMCLGILFPSCGHDDEPNNPYEQETSTNSDTDNTDNTGSSENNGNSSGGSNQSSYQSILLKYVSWHWSGGHFTFYETNKIEFVTTGKDKIGSYGVPYLRARGTFTISGSTLTATYSSVDVYPSLTDSQMSRNFPGWSVGTSRTIVYTIKSISDSELILTDGSKTWTLESGL